MTMHWYRSCRERLLILSTADTQAEPVLMSWFLDPTSDTFEIGLYPSLRFRSNQDLMEHLAHPLRKYLRHTDTICRVLDPKCKPSKFRHENKDSRCRMSLTEPI